VSAVVFESRSVAGLVMSATGVKACPSAPAPPRPVVSNDSAAPPDVAEIVMSEPDAVLTK